jgi:hypothetical protein
VLCGIVASEPELVANERQGKLISGGWYPLAEAEVAFQIQSARLHERGQRNLHILDLIRAIDLSDL